MNNDIFNINPNQSQETKLGLLIDGHWCKGQGEALIKFDPYHHQLLWQGLTANAQDVDKAVKAAHFAQRDWYLKGLEYRIDVLKKYADLLVTNKEYLAQIIAQETGKPNWDALTEVQAMIGKIAISIQAYHERTPTKSQTIADGSTHLMHRPHGVMAILGPYNFPGHLPNGHIVPALLAGNTVVFKPSEQTPLTAECLVKLLEQAGITHGAINLVQGAKETGIALISHELVNGILFTGSAKTGTAIHRQLAGQVDKMLALEMGGNNALIVNDFEDLDASVHVTIQSAFLSAGQRCTCARRLFVKKGKEGDRFINSLVELTARIKIGSWNSQPEPFMGTVISPEVATHLLSIQSLLIAKGAKSLLAMKRLEESQSLVTPGIIDATGVNLPDDEYFGPLLTLYRYEHFEEAITMANQTQYGLSAGLISNDLALFDYFRCNIKAGIVNLNKPLTGASSNAPFGGVGLSGNHRPSAFYAADYCAWPMASMSTQELSLPQSIAPGLPFGQKN